MNYSTEQIWKDFSKSLRAFISRKVMNQSYVEDLLQDVFLKIHSNIDTLQDSNRIRNWVYQIAHNTIVDFYRKHKIEPKDLDSMILEDEDAFQAMDDVSEETPAWEIAAGLKEMVNALPAKYAQALLLVEFQGLSQIELSKELGISISGAKSRVQRGRKMLKDSLMRCCHFEFDHFGTIIGFHPVGCCCCKN